jgi:hypothetical protein
METNSVCFLCPSPDSLDRTSVAEFRYKSLQLFIHRYYAHLCKLEGRDETTVQAYSRTGKSLGYSINCYAICLFTIVLVLHVKPITKSQRLNDKSTRTFEVEYQEMCVSCHVCDQLTCGVRNILWLVF